MVEVTQEDRDAAARAGLDIARLNERDADALRQGGEWDEWSFVQAFARHRTTALAAQVEEIAALKVEVERLRDAAIDLRDGLLMRAEIDREGIATVAAGNGVWCRFNDAIDAVRPQGIET